MIIDKCRGIARATALFAAMAGFVAIGVGAVALAPSSVLAQIAVPPYERLEIPDLPCMTPEEHRTLREMSDEYYTLEGQIAGVHAEMDQISPEFAKYERAEGAIYRFQLGDFDAVSMQEYEAARETASRLRPVNERHHVLNDALGKLQHKRKVLKLKFTDLLRPIRSRKCPPPTPSARELQEQKELQEQPEIGLGPAQESPTAIPVSTPSFAGVYLGPHGSVYTGSLHTNEYFAFTGEQTNHFSNPGWSFGGGGQIGFLAFPFTYNTINTLLCWQYFGLGGEISLDGLGQRNRQVFSAEAYLGTRTDFSVSALVKFAFAPNPNFMLYNLVGWTGVSQQVQINFGAPFITNESRFTSGLTIGTGVEFRPPGLNLAGQPLTIFWEYKHTFLQAAYLNQPLAAPFFKYRFRGDENSLLAGVNMYLSTH